MVGQNPARSCNLILSKYFSFNFVKTFRLHPDSKFEYRECFDIIRKNPIYPNDDILTFESTNTKLQYHCQKLIRNLLRLLALSLKLDDPEYFVKCSRHLDNPETENECDFSMIHYPPIHSDTILPPDTIRCAEHTDYEILTLLFQNEVGGLEVYFILMTFIITVYQLLL